MTTMLSGHRAVRRAFSLVEMVIVIGIIVLLVGLTVAVLGSCKPPLKTHTPAALVSSMNAFTSRITLSSISFGGTAPSG